ncbi:Acetoin utilization protein AcuA [Pelotomaculum schinkii]|uniref:Acetoin utilization protein AcuA n=1 Tax=Pelotomaculum schinkii TaxID=78350 RepID=A0A4Y7RCS1_9FIRM|nr:GNAT family N-acetyltransferase [Pelotomaculum schinkii]TEB06815.1 Acetoin utilization protein AcuA [Pelotomaculum schinkii]
MSTACCAVESLKTSLGEILIEGPLEAAKLEELSMNNKLTVFRPPAKQKEALAAIARLPEGMVYIARYGREIAGYVTFHYPDGFSRWSKHPAVLELGGIEISPDWRQRGIGVALLREAFSNPVMENHIIVTVEFCWHWDLKSSGLDLFMYQKMLARLFGSVGLSRRDTDDPDIVEHPANVLMVRVGANVSCEDNMKFDNMLFEDSGYKI